MPTAAAEPASTASPDWASRRGHPITSAVAVPISGVISMAPITTASEFRDSPSTAITTDSASITMNRNHQ